MRMWLAVSNIQSYMDAAQGTSKHLDFAGQGIETITEGVGRAAGLAARCQGDKTRQRVGFNAPRPGGIC